MRKDRIISVSHALAAVILYNVAAVAAGLPVPANVFYSESHHFRVVYPVGVVRHREAASRAKHERESFEITSPDGQTLRGVVTADEDNKASAAALAAAAIAGIKNANVTLRVVKQDWYAISGTQGENIFYQKGLAGSVHRSVRFDYPAKAKQYFDPMVASMANSLEAYIYLRAKVMLVDRREDGGWLWFQQEPDGAVNDRTICYYSEADAAKFDKLKEGQSVTVAGKPVDLIIRQGSEQQAGLYETSIKSCLLLDPK